MPPQIKLKMRKGFLSILLFAALAVAPFGATANAKIAGQAENSPKGSPVVETIEVVEAPAGAAAANASEANHRHPAMENSGKDFEESWEGENESWIREEPDAFTSDYGESQIARKMTQAEKNRNAAENDGWGGAITIIAMCIVISALVVLSILFLIFGKVSEAIITAKKMRAKRAAAHVENEAHEELAPGEVIAAISLALVDYFGGKHDIEDTHLTITRLQKAYSPWNSKIYNLRHIEDHRRNPSQEINYHESKRIQI